MITLSNYWITFLIGTALPVVVALITQKVTSSSVKSVVLLLLSALAGTLTSIQVSGGVFEWRNALATFSVTFITAVAAHLGLLKPTGVTGSQGVLQAKRSTEKLPKHRA